jgi:hypothetical protein
MWKKKMKKQMDEIYTKGTKEIDENNIIALLGVHEISRNMAIGMKLQNMMFKYIQSALFAIMYYVKLNDFDRCNIVVRQLIDDIQIENIMLSEPDKGKIIDLLQVTPSREKIKSFDILYRLLIMLPAYSPSPQEPQ